MPDFATLTAAVDSGVATVRLNRPDRANSINAQMWTELLEVFRWADQAPEVRVVALFGNGKHFCSGIDLAELLAVQQLIADTARGARTRSCAGSSSGCKSPSPRRRSAANPCWPRSTGPASAAGST